MEFVIGTAAVIVLFFAGGYYMQKKAEKAAEQRIRKNFGLVPEIEYTQEKYVSIGYYFREMRKKYPEDKKHTVIDDITWHDLDMDRVFITACATQSSIGEEYLYYLMRTPVLDNEELEKREELIKLFSENEEVRVRLQKELNAVGKMRNVSVYEYLSCLNKLEEESNIKHYLCLLLLFGSIALISFNPVGGLMATFGVFFYNVLSYFKRKGEIENYYSVVAYILRTLDLCGRLGSIDNEVLKPYLDELLEQRKKFKDVTRGAGIIVSRNSNGNILEVVFDYFRMATHIDLIRFNTMLTRLKNRKDDYDRMYSLIGLLDAMTAAASFRKLMHRWCVPELDRGTKGIHTQSIFHPMIIDPVRNSFDEDGNVLLTGSNASGKSTFIKTIAINSILAQSIHTVMADSYRACFFKCMTSMALTDNLSDGESYYIVEIKSLKRICDSLNEDVPLLIFIDEVLRGTNTLERIAASSKILSYIGKRNCMLFAATHDIELTYILQKSFKLYHFEEKVEDDGVKFDYKLKDGRAVTRNAILLLKLLGFEKEITDAAEIAADGYVNSGEWSEES